MSKVLSFVDGRERVEQRRRAAAAEAPAFSMALGAVIGATEHFEALAGALADGNPAVALNRIEDLQRALDAARFWLDPQLAQRRAALRALIVAHGQEALLELSPLTDVQGGVTKRKE